MPILTRLIVLTTCLTSVATAQVAVRIGKNHELVKRLLQPVIARANQSTVRILTGPRGKDVALGAIVRADGYILTHSDGLPRQPVCQLSDGRRASAVRVAEIADHGLVLLRIAAGNLPITQWRQGPKPPLGRLLATPGRGPNPVAIGIVSSEARSAPGRPGDDRFQHDSILRPIDCGGPVVDLSGLAVGLNVVRADRVTTIALSVAAVRDILQTYHITVEAVPPPRQGRPHNDSQLPTQEGSGVDLAKEAHAEGQTLSKDRGPAPRRPATRAGAYSLEELQAKIRTAAVAAVACTVAVQSGSIRGSGVIASPDGYVLTAAHVCPAANREANIRLADGRTATAICRGADRAADAGLIQLDGTGPWPHADTSRWPRAQRGQWCIATGYPHGRHSGEPPVVRLGRVLACGTDLIMTDCTLTQGDSGGPLFDLDGHLLAIHSRIGRHLANNVHVPIGRYRTDWPRLRKGDVWGQPMRIQPADNGENR